MDIPTKVFKFSKGQFAKFDNPRIIIFKEKHADRHFYSASQKNAAKIFLHILQERVEEGYWYDLSDEVGEIQGKFSVHRNKSSGVIFYNTPPDITKLMSEKEQMAILLNTEDKFDAGIMAYTFLEARCEYEYEEFISIQPEN